MVLGIVSLLRSLGNGLSNVGNGFHFLVRQLSLEGERDQDCFRTRALSHSF